MYPSVARTDRGHCCSPWPPRSISRPSPRGAAVVSRGRSISCPSPGEAAVVTSPPPSAGQGGGGSRRPPSWGQRRTRDPAALPPSLRRGERSGLLPPAAALHFLSSCPPSPPSYLAGAGAAVLPHQACRSPAAVLSSPLAAARADAPPSYPQEQGQHGQQQGEAVRPLLVFGSVPSAPLSPREAAQNPLRCVLSDNSFSSPHGSNRPPQLALA